MDREPSPAFVLEPISAAVLATSETRRRDQAAALGRLRTGCDDVDDYVLLGGLERGSVVGVSAEEEDAVGVTVSSFDTGPSIYLLLPLILC